MIIITDNTKTAKNYFDTIDKLTPNFHLENSIKNVKRRIFRNNPIQIFESREKYDWDYLFLTEYSSESQFDIINKLISQNIEVPNKFICLAEEGDGFHGFRNRSWKAEKGNIHLSLFFKPQKAGKNFHAGLLIIAAVAVLKTIDSIPKLNEKAKTKWVNDIIIDNSKVCGIITQSFSSGSTIDGAVIGLGLNVLSNPQIECDIFTPKTSSLLVHSNSNDCYFPKILSNLLINLSNGIDLLNKGYFKDLLDIYVKRSAVLGKKVSIYSDPYIGDFQKIISSKVIDINENLELIIESSSLPIKSGRLSFDSKN